MATITWDPPPSVARRRLFGGAGFLFPPNRCGAWDSRVVMCRWVRVECDVLVVCTTMQERGAARNRCASSGRLRDVTSERAQLSSATTSLEELIDRVSSTAESVLASGDESLASDLFEVERSLRTAHRRLLAASRRIR